MRKFFKNLSATLLAALLLSASISIPTFAASEKNFSIPESKDCSLTISNVVEEKTIGEYKIYVANAPVTVTFTGKGLGRESVWLMPDAEIISEKYFDEGLIYEDVTFKVKKYTYFGATEVFDEVTQEPDETQEISYLTGNYAEITKPGFYFVKGSAPATAGTSVWLQVTGDTTAPVTNEPTVVSAAPTASKVLVNSKPVSFSGIPKHYAHFV